MPTRSSQDRWLFGPAPDLLLGCGLGYVLLFATLILTGTERSNSTVLFLSPFLVIFTGTPHYGATLLRVYEDASERHKYAFFAIWATAAVWGVFYLGLYSAAIGSLLLTVYLTWSPWHYSGQNYGIALLFLRRRGVEITPPAKRAIYLSFTFSFVLTVLALHGYRPTSASYAAVQPYQGGVFHLSRLGIPSPWWEYTFMVVGIAYLGMTLDAARRLLRHSSLRDIAPAAVLVGVQMLWFALPAVARRWDILGIGSAFGGDGSAYAFMWVAAGHTVQYLWITTYYAAGDRGAGTRLLYLAKTLAAGSFIWSVPALIYALSVEGGRFGGAARGPDVGVLLASAVNIHHFILDGAIWKLRDGRVARILIRRDESGARPEAIGPGGAARRRHWLAPLVYATGTLATIAVVSSAWVKQTALRPALMSGDLRTAREALNRLDWLGHDEAGDYRRFAMLAGAVGENSEAMQAYSRSLEKHPSAITYAAMGELLHRNGLTREAENAFYRALEINSRHLGSIRSIGLIRLQRGEVESAIEMFEQGLSLSPNDEKMLRSMDLARKRQEPRPTRSGGGDDDAKEGS